MRKDSRYKEKRNNEPYRSGIERIRGVFSYITNKLDGSGYAGLFLTLLIVGVYIVSRSMNSANPAQVRFVESNSLAAIPKSADSNAQIIDAFTDPKYQTAMRLREAGALGIAVSLAVFSRYSAAKQLPRNEQDVVAEVINRKLMPPGLTLEKGNILSETSILRLNYRASPLSFEVLSLPIDGKTGASLLFQFPLPPTKAQSVMYFRSSKGRLVPSPFNASEQLVANGWHISHWDPADIALDNSATAAIREQSEWIRSVTSAK